MNNNSVLVIEIYLVLQLFNKGFFILGRLYNYYIVEYLIKRLWNNSLIKYRNKYKWNKYVHIELFSSRFQNLIWNFIPLPKLLSLLLDIYKI